jgi:small subunit ribosomal protein S4
MCRREGTKLNLKGDKCATAKCPVSRRAFPPGQHGPTQRVRLTGYGTQLREKQKAKNTYGILERQFRNYFEKAASGSGNTAERFVQLLEMRLDNIVYRLGIAKSRASARQMIGHGSILVDGKKVTIPSYQCVMGEVVTVAARHQKSRSFQEEQSRQGDNRETPSWIHFDKATVTGKILSKPEGEDLNQNFNPKLIVEFYSR